MWWSFDSSAASGWSVSTANPRTGTYHLRQTLAAETSFPWLHASNFFVCRDRYEANFWQVAATAVVDPGDLWEISFYAMASTLTQTNGYSVDAIYAPEASDSDDYTTTVIDHQVLTTSYAEFTGGETVPDEATTGFTAPYLLFVSIQNRWIGNSGTVTIDLDDVTLSVL